MQFLSYQTLDQLISRKSTGTVYELALKLNVSERTVKKMVEIMRNQCECKIKYDSAKRSYIYLEEGSCEFTSKKSRKEYIASELNKALRRLLTFALISATFLDQLTVCSFFCPVAV